jgi:hypothetical protein
MDSLVGFLQSILGLKARQGWIFLFTGAAMLTLTHADILPEGELAAGWLAAFWLSTVSGAAILVVSGGYSIYNHVEHRCKLRQKKAERERLEKDAVKSAEILKGYVAGELLSVLRSDNPRFTSYDPGRLHSKHIIRSVQLNVFEVVDPVWSDRSRLIKILEARVHLR